MGFNAEPPGAKIWCKDNTFPRKTSSKRGKIAMCVGRGSNGEIMDLWSDRDIEDEV